MKKLAMGFITLLMISSAANADDTGQKIYKEKCFACHDAGVAGAPKLGDKAAWEPRLAEGMDTVMKIVMNGKNAMPPKGTCMDCSEADLKAVVDYMVSKVK